MSKAISELNQAESLQSNDIFEVSVVSPLSTTGYASKKTSIAQLGSEINGDLTYSQLDNSSIISAINNCILNFTSKYSSESTYVVGDYSIYENVLYKCISQISTPEAFNTSHWSQVDVASELKSIVKVFNDLATPYSSSSTYDIGEYVIYNNILYKCSTTISSAEDFNISHWTQVNVGDELEILTTSSQTTLNDLAPQYDPTSTYVVDDYVIYEGVLYKCILDIVSPEEFNSTKWSATNVTDNLSEGATYTAGNNIEISAQNEISSVNTIVFNAKYIRGTDTFQYDDTAIAPFLTEVFKNDKRAIVRVQDGNYNIYDIYTLRHYESSNNTAAFSKVNPSIVTTDHREIVCSNIVLSVVNSVGTLTYTNEGVTDLPENATQGQIPISDGHNGWIAGNIPAGSYTAGDGINISNQNVISNDVIKDLAEEYDSSSTYVIGDYAWIDEDPENASNDAFVKGLYKKINEPSNSSSAEGWYQCTQTFNLSGGATQAYKSKNGLDTYLCYIKNGSSNVFLITSADTVAQLEVSMGGASSKSDISLDSTYTNTAGNTYNYKLLGNIPNISPMASQESGTLTLVETSINDALAALWTPPVQEWEKTDVGTELKTLKSSIVSFTDLTGTLTAGSTSLTISDTSITTSSTIDYYTDVYGVNPTDATVVNGSVTLTFDAQSSDIHVKVRVW